MAPRDNEPSLFDDQEGPDLSSPGEGFELYRHKNADKMRTKGWHGYYWARLNEQGDYEIRGVPSSLGEHSRPGGVFPREGFEEHYEKVESWANTEQVLWRPRFLNIRACPLPTPVFAAGRLGYESIGTPCGSSRGMDGKYNPAGLQETKRYYGNVDSLSDGL